MENNRKELLENNLLEYNNIAISKGITGNKIEKELKKDISDKERKMLETERNRLLIEGKIIYSTKTKANKLRKRYLCLKCGKLYSNLRYKNDFNKLYMTIELNYLYKYIDVINDIEYCQIELNEINKHIK